MIFALVVGGLILGVLLYVAGTWNYKYFEKLGIPYVKPVPWLGNMTSFVFRQTSLMDFIANLHKAFPDRKFIGVYEFRNPIVLVNDPELIKQITVKDFDHFIDHRFTIDPNVEPMFGRNLVSIKGNKWREMRATLSPAFTGSKMRNMFVLVTECAEELIKYLNSLESKDRTIEMKDLFTRYANDVIASAAFGLKVDSLREPNNEFYVMTKEISLFRGIQALKFFGFTAFPKLMKFLNIQMFGPRIQKFYRNLVMDTMKQRDEQNIVRPDMIHLLMQVRQGTLKHEEVVDTKDAGFATVTESEIGKSSNNITHWEDDDLTAQAVIFLFAGFETSSTLMCFVCHELALQPEIQKKLQTEIDQVRSNNNKITYEVIQSMKYLDMVISETLRLWPPGIFLDRMCVKPYTIVDEDNNVKIDLKPGDGVWVAVSGIHRNPKYYPNPDTFDPERFSDSNKSSIDPYAYLPFGAGPRNCIGSRFALMEVKALVFYILESFDLEPCYKTQIPLKLCTTSANPTAKGGFWLDFKLRQKKPMN